MRLEDCILSVDVAATAPITRAEPETEWKMALDSNAIPVSLFELYCKAHFLSFGTAPAFLKDEDNVLFSYFGMLLRSLSETLQDTDEQVRSFIEVQKHTYDVGKKIRNESWDPTADARARRHFRDLLIALQSSLDTLADLAALFFTGLIPGLRLGRAQFVSIEAWLKTPLPPTGAIATPYDKPLQLFYEALGPVVCSGGPELDWLPLMRLLRNKAAHLGQPVFRQVGLHDATPRFYTFIPRQWPYIWERHIKPHDPTSQRDPDFLRNFFLQTLIHQDIATYSRGLRAKVQDVVSAGISVLVDTFEFVEDFATNQKALAELESSSQTYRFEYFANV